MPCGEKRDTHGTASPGPLCKISGRLEYVTGKLNPASLPAQGTRPCGVAGHGQPGDTASWAARRWGGQDVRLRGHRHLCRGQHKRDLLLERLA